MTRRLLTRGALALLAGTFLCIFFMTRQAASSQPAATRRKWKIAWPPGGNLPEPSAGKPRQPHSGGKKRTLLTGTAGALVLAAAAYVFFVHPAVFPDEVQAGTSFDVDPAEGNVWLTSQIAFEVRGQVTAAEVLKELRFTPKLPLTERDVSVEHLAMFPWHERMPWARTRIDINASHEELFQPETRYTLKFRDVSERFETIVLPRVVEVQTVNPPAEDLAKVPTTSAFVLHFNEEVEWSDGLLHIEPPIEFTTIAESSTEGGTIVHVTPVERWDNGTAYTLRVDAAVEDVHGHRGGEVFARTFTTVPRPNVISIGPTGESVPVDAPVRVEFDRDVDRASVEAAFKTEPVAAGGFTWDSERVVTWRPAGLANSTHYKISVAGAAPGGDLVVPMEWTFRTYDPPVFVEIRGRDYTPAVLEAVPSGGLGNYSLKWSNGEVANRILYVGPPGPHNVEVTVQSGDRTATAVLPVTGPPEGSYVPQNCPPGWVLMEVSVCYHYETLAGNVKTWVARVDLKDSSLQVRSVPAGDRLGLTQLTSEAARARGSNVMINGDFFHTTNAGTFTLGPIMSSGSFAAAPLSFETVMAISRERSVWTGPATELRFTVQAGDGSALRIQGVNHIPAPNSISIFNSYWGPELNVAAEGCVAWFFPADGSPRVPDNFGCGPLKVGLPAGAYALVAVGSAADWLRERAGGVFAVDYSFPLANVDFMVGGSHPLIQGGNLAQVPADQQHPRSLIGMDGTGFLYLAAVDGRSEDSGGMSLPELQAYAQSLGLRDALNLDGGGSTTLVVQGTLVNRPSDGAERPVAGFVEVGPTRGGCRSAFVRC
jgi:hypothetical protein